MINVLMVEDDPMAKTLFEMYIEESENYKLIASIESAAMAELYCTTNKINLILMDILTELGASGLETAKKIKKNHPDIKIIIMTSLPECDFIDRAKDYGVDSFWYKTPSQKAIIEVMDKTVKGERVYPERNIDVKVGSAISKDFTDLELKVLREITTGDTDEVIAERLKLSPWTVRKYVKLLLDKTNFKSRTQLAVAARESGLVVKGY